MVLMLGASAGGELFFYGGNTRSLLAHLFKSQSAIR